MHEQSCNEINLKKCPLQQTYFFYLRNAFNTPLMFAVKLNYCWKFRLKQVHLIFSIPLSVLFFLFLHRFKRNRFGIRLLSITKYQNSLLFACWSNWHSIHNLTIFNKFYNVTKFTHYEHNRNETKYFSQNENENYIPPFQQFHAFSNCKHSFLFTILCCFCPLIVCHSIEVWKCVLHFTILHRNE